MKLVDAWLIWKSDKDYIENVSILHLVSTEYEILIEYRTFEFTIRFMHIFDRRTNNRLDS